MAGQTNQGSHLGELKQLRQVTAGYMSGPAAPWTVQVFDLAGITCIQDPNGTGTVGIHFVDGPNLMDGKVNRFTRVEAGNRYGLPAFYELHLWFERSNPLGLFNDWNPNVHC